VHPPSGPDLLPPSGLRTMGKKEKNMCFCHIVVLLLEDLSEKKAKSTAKGFTNNITTTLAIQWDLMPFETKTGQWLNNLFTLLIN